MRKVVTISLNGNAYQIEEGGYEALRAYLEDAQHKLRDDPDCAEIIGDLEQAIAEKCGRFLGARKSVVSAEEVQQLLAEIGPVDAAAGADAAARAFGGDAGHSGAGGAADAPAAAGSEAGGKRGGSAGSAGTGGAAAAPRRLYQIREGALISGLCNGIAAYLNIDVLIVRIIFVALALLTWGAWIVVYIVLMFVIPFASTSEDRAAAHGLPFTAQLLVEEAKRHYTQFRHDARWRHHQHRQTRRQRRQWRAQWRQERRAWRAQRHWGWWVPPAAPPGAHTPPYGPPGYAAQLLAGVLAPLASLGSAALLIVLLIGIVQLISHGVVFGWPRPAGLPLWAAVLILLIIYSVVSMPLRAVRHAAHYARGAGANIWLALWGSVLWMACIVLFVWLASHFWPQLQQLLRQLTDALGRA